MVSINLVSTHQGAQMSASTLHHHFRLLTAMSPLQYQKWLRLNEARRLMLNERFDAASAALQKSATKAHRNSAVNTVVSLAYHPAVDFQTKPNWIRRNVRSKIQCALHISLFQYLDFIIPNIGIISQSQ